MQQNLKTPVSSPLTQAELAMDQVEQHLEAVSAAVRTGEPEALEAASHQLRNAALALANVLDASTAGLAKPLAGRLDQAVRLIGMQREQLARRAGLVDRALASVLPEAPVASSAVYAPAGARSTRGSVARIYDIRG